jgi:polyferredoxin
MTKQPAKKKMTEEEIKKEMKIGEPWIQMNTGMKVIAILSIVMAIYITWNLTPSEGFWMALVWGVGFGASLWAIFLGGLLINKIFRR